MHNASHSIRLGRACYDCGQRSRNSRPLIPLSDRHRHFEPVSDFVSRSLCNWPAITRSPTEKNKKAEHATRNDILLLLLLLLPSLHFFSSVFFFFFATSTSRLPLFTPRWATLLRASCSILEHFVYIQLNETVTVCSRVYGHWGQKYTCDWRWNDLEILGWIVECKEQKWRNRSLGNYTIGR